MKRGRPSRRVTIGENASVSPTNDDRRIALLRQRPFVQFAVASAAASFAFQMMSVAVGWQVYALTHRAFDLGLVGLVQFVPSLLLALPAGHWADRFDRRRIVLVAQVVATLAIAAMAWLSGAGHLDERGIFGLLFVVGVALAIEWPAESSILPALVPVADLSRAMALSSSGRQAATIVGPALGGLLYLAGPATVYAVAAGLLALSVVLIATLRYRQVRVPQEPVTLKTVFAGAAFIKSHPDVLGVISLDLFAVLLGGATALLPIFASDILHTNTIGLGVLRAAPAVGALLMSLALARRSIESRVGLTMFGAVAGFGVGTLVFAFSTTLWLSVLALFALGAFDMVSVVIRSALVQLDTPDAMRGRVNGVNAIFINTSNQLGEFESGLLASWVGAVGAAAIGGIGTLAVVAVWMLLFPSLRRRQRLHEADEMRSRPSPG